MKYLTAIMLWLVASQMLSQPLKERVILFTDRNLFISGETIQFTALIKSETDSNSVSRILYCELITGGGRRMAGGKYATENSAVSGHLAIPAELVSGIYYLKAYTKTMRNEGPSVYSYDLIKVVNPYSDEVNVEAGDASGTGGSALVIDTSIRNSFDVPAHTLPGDTVRFNIKDPSICRTLKNLTISVIPDGTLSDKLIALEDAGLNENSHRQETRGMSITGLVRNRYSGSVIPGIRVNLSITGEGRDFMATTTGPDGGFVFNVPDYNGKHDIFLCTDKTDSLDAQILVDNDFCNLPVDLPDEDYELSDRERETALSMAIRFNLNKYFNNDSLEAERDTTVQSPVFYGKPDEILSMNEYVKLPTLEEYFNQLPVSVKVRKKSGQKYFKVLGTQSELLEIDPLVMVDLVVIDDPEKILALDPRDISRIEIVNSVYVKGDQIYGGVVNILSRNENFAGISLPSSGIFINYSFLNNTFNNQEFTALNSKLPDTRNTVFWKTISNWDECSGISFIAPATPGKYQVLVRGVSEKGEEVSSIWHLTVY